MVAAAFTAVVTGGVLAWFLFKQSPSSAAVQAAVLSLLLTYSGAAIGVLRWMSSFGTEAAVDVAASRERLRKAVERSWGREVDVRPAHLPHPMALRLQRTTLVGAQVASGPRGEDSDQQRSPVTVLSHMMRDPDVRQVVVLGEPGAGKTTLVSLYIARQVRENRERGAVPAYLSIAAWDPIAVPRVDDWVVERISQDYPQLSRAEATELVDEREIIAVLDGLDEMSSRIRTTAARQLERAAAAGLRMVLTCRRTEFTELTREYGVLPQALVMEIGPVDPANAAIYLTEREPKEATRWKEVVAALRDPQGGPLSATLSTPLMIAMARQVYQSQGSRPEDLISENDQANIERRLLDGFLLSAYGDNARAERAGQTLAFLSRRLSGASGDPNLHWWRLGQAVPRWLPVSMILSLTACIAIPMTVFDTLLGSVLLVAALVSAVYAFGPVHSMNHHGRFRSLVTRVGRALFDAYVAVAVTAGLASVVLLLLRRFAPITAATSADAFRDWSYFDRVDFAVIGAFGLAAFVASRGLTFGRRGYPRRIALRWRRLPRHLLSGFVIGLVATSLIMIVAIYDAGTEIVGDGEDLAMLAIAVVLVGWMVGVGRWLSSPVRDEDHESTSSPPAMLAGDRTALLVMVTGVFTTIGGLGAVIFPAMDYMFGYDEYMFEYFIQHPIEYLVNMSIIASVAATLVLAGSGSVWLSYSVARIWFALIGRLPWRPMRFLEDAYQRGVLRRVGPAYQFRHDRVRSYVELRWPTAALSPVDNRRGHFRRRFIWTAATIIGATIALAFSSLVAQADSTPRVGVGLNPSE